jgi:hypothetical protein
MQRLADVGQREEVARKDIVARRTKRDAAAL